MIVIYTCSVEGFVSDPGWQVMTRVLYDGRIAMRSLKTLSDKELHALGKATNKLALFTRLASLKHPAPNEKINFRARLDSGFCINLTPFLRTQLRYPCRIPD